MGLLCSRRRSQGRYKMSVNLCPDDIFSVCLIVFTQYFLNCSTIFLTKLGMVVYYYEVICRAEKVVHYLQCHGHSKGLYNQTMTIFPISSKVLVRLQTSLIWQCIRSQSVLWKSGITAFNLKVTAKAQNVSECLSGQYFLNHRTFCQQIW